MVKRLIIVVLALVVVFGGIFGWKAFVRYKIAQAMAARKPPPVTVSAVEAQILTWQPKILSVGSVRAVQGINVTSAVAGKIRAIAFKSGGRVQKGDVLVRLEASVDKAQLRSLKAQLELARIDLNRIKKLVARDAVSESKLDKARARYQRLQAEVAAQQALIAKKTIVAPFTGMLGIRLIDLGEYVAPGDDIVTLQALEPIHVDFSLPQERLPQLEPGLTVRVTTAAYPNRTFTGKITAINSKVEEATRNVRVQATVDNSQRLLMPGMFVDVAVLLPVTKKVVTLPQTAITYNPYGDSVFIVQPPEEGGEQALPTVTRVFVKTGETRGNQVQILKGVEPGQRVVTAGQLKLREGARVRIDNEITPGNYPSRKPAEPLEPLGQ